VRTVYLGTSGFAASVLERLAGTPHRPVLVVTRPDRPAGRGRRLTAPPVAGVAKRLGIDLDQPEDVNGPEARARIAAAAPDVVVVCAFGAIIKEPLLSDFEMLNVHPSLLPRWRGAAPVERAIMAGDAETGVSIMRLTEGLDSGPVCLAEREPIRPDDDYGSLSVRLSAVGGEALVRWGGEEFVVMLPATDMDGMRIVARRLEDALRGMRIAHPASPFGVVTVSIGGVTWLRPDGATNPENLVMRADAALYEAKAMGRNRIHLVRVPAG